VQTRNLVAALTNEGIENASVPDLKPASIGELQGQNTRWLLFSGLLISYVRRIVRRVAGRIPERRVIIRAGSIPGRDDLRSSPKVAFRRVDVEAAYYSS
jgi:hypothetical protein